MTGQLKAALANRQALPEAAFEDALDAPRSARTTCGRGR